MGGIFLNLSGETGVEGDDVLTITYGENTTALSAHGYGDFEGDRGYGSVRECGAFDYAGGRRGTHVYAYAYVYASAHRRYSYGSRGLDISIALTLGAVLPAGRQRRRLTMCL